MSLEEHKKLSLKKWLYFKFVFPLFYIKQLVNLVDKLDKNKKH